MANGANITRKQHYIPQVYLRGFANNPGEIKPFIYQMDLLTGETKSVPIRSILYEADLYEIEPNIKPNLCEDKFGEIEGIFGQIKNKITEKICKRNTELDSFLTEEELVFLYFFFCFIFFAPSKYAKYS